MTSLAVVAHRKKTLDGGLSELRQLLAAARGPELSTGFVQELEKLATVDCDLIDPTRWPS